MLAKINVCHFFVRMFQIKCVINRYSEHNKYLLLCVCVTLALDVSHVLLLTQSYGKVTFVTNSVSVSHF